jgi:hypothetical protein
VNARIAQLTRQPQRNGALSYLEKEDERHVARIDRDVAPTHLFEPLDHGRVTFNNPCQEVLKRSLQRQQRQTLQAPCNDTGYA